MRRSFAEVLKNGKVDIADEFLRLYVLFYKPNEYGDKSDRSIYWCINRNFKAVPFRGTCLTLDDFDNHYGFDFDVDTYDITTDLLVDFCEYLTNLCNCSFQMPLHLYGADSQDVFFLLNQIELVIDKIGYTKAREDGHTIYVEKDPAAIAAAEIVPENLSYKVIEYNHHSMRGDLAAKKETLLKLANAFEPIRASLKGINKSLESDISYGLNNLNIRHNNCETVNKHYKQIVAKMPDDELEVLYDDLYQMMLLAFLECENIDRSKRFSLTKAKIENPA